MTVIVLRDSTSHQAGHAAGNARHLHLSVVLLGCMGASAASQGKVCAAVCHGPAALTEAELDGEYLVKGKKVRPVELPSTCEMSWAPPGLMHPFFPDIHSLTLQRTWPVLALDRADDHCDNQGANRHCLHC